VTDPYHPITPDAPRPKRKSIADAHGKRWLLVERDGDQCWICGRTLVLYQNAGPGRALPEDYATLDHVVPASLGGHATLENLRLACPKCNRDRGATPADQVRTWRS
jgi:5-methylcytosine-specific restriction endonuclease McrA